MDKWQKNRKIALSVVSLVVCFAMLTGTTLAWFTSSVSNVNNQIKAGELEVQVLGYSADSDTVNKLDSSSEIDFAVNTDTPLISETNWVAGQSATKYITIKNNGSIDVSYALTFVVDDSDGLASALWYKITKASSVAGGVVTEGTATEDTTGEIVMSALESETFVANLELKANTEETYIIEYGMFDTAGPTYANKTISVDILVLATQVLPDATATYASYVSTAADIMAAPAGSTVIFTGDITGDVTLTDYLNIDFNGFSLKGDLEYKITSGELGTIDIGTAADGDATPASTQANITGDITVYAPNATVNHYGTYGGDVDITEVASHSYNLYASPSAGSTGNVSITAGALNLYADEEGTTTSVTVTGDAENVAVSDQRASAVSGESATGTSTVNIIVEAGATGTTITYATDSGESMTTSGDFESNLPTAAEQFILDLEAAETGDTVTLTGDVTLDSNLYIYGKAISIDMNGYDLTISGVFLLEYAGITDIATGASGGTWYSITDGTVTGTKTSGYAPVYSKDTPESVFQADTVIVVLGSGNFGISTVKAQDAEYNYQVMYSYTTSGKGSIFSTGYYIHLTSNGSIADWSGIDAWLETHAELETGSTISPTVYVTPASTTITIGTPTT